MDGDVTGPADMQDDTPPGIRQNWKTAENPDDTGPSRTGLWAIIETAPDNY
jgi:hypothetical protein